MRIKITEVLDNNKIVLKTDYGNIIANWKGDECIIQKEYFVEFDIPYKLHSKKITLSKNETYKLQNIEDKVNIIGLLESYEDDGYATLRINESIICFDTIYDSKIMEMCGQYVALSIDKMDVYDNGVI